MAAPSVICLLTSSSSSPPFAPQPLPVLERQILLALERVCSQEELLGDPNPVNILDFPCGLRLVVQVGIFDFFDRAAEVHLRAYAFGDFAADIASGRRPSLVSEAEYWWMQVIPDLRVPMFRYWDETGVPHWFAALAACPVAPAPEARP